MARIVCSLEAHEFLNSKTSSLTHLQGSCNIKEEKIHNLHILKAEIPAEHDSCYTTLLSSALEAVYKTTASSTLPNSML